MGGRLSRPGVLLGGESPSPGESSGVGRDRVRGPKETESTGPSM